MPAGIRLALLTLGSALLGAPVAHGAPATECRGTIYLTFDTGSMSQAELIARTLREERVRATFFLANEKTVRGDYSLDPAWKDYWRGLVADGHRFGSHTWGHQYARGDHGDKVRLADAGGHIEELGQAGYCRELARVNDRFRELTGQPLDGLWRAPGGRTTQNTIRWAASCGYPVHVGWDDAGFIGDELDSDTHPNAALLERALARVGPGTVTMMHLGIRSRKDPLAPILKPLIQGLRAKGYCFEPLAAARN